jgi:(R,R)-butanediol dehydrogenase / meso-butanediol dehydrogenase / diacetyl reductase
VGIPGLVQHATEVAALDGRVVIAGVCMGEDTLVPLVGMSKELDLRFAFYYRAGDYRTTIDMIDRGRIDPLPLVTDEITLDALPERFDTLKAPTDDCKVLIRPNR